MRLTGDKQNRIKELAIYLLIRTQIVLGSLTVVCAAFQQIILFGILLIIMGIILVSVKEAFTFFQVIAKAIIDWKYKNGNYRDSEMAGKAYRKPEDWLALALILDYFMIEIMGQSR